MYKQDIKEKIKERYGKIALLSNVDSCCMPGGCCQVNDDDNNNKNDHNTFASPIQSSKIIGYDADDLESIPQSSILGVGCGAPTKFAHIKEGDLGCDPRYINMYAGSLLLFSTYIMSYMRLLIPMNDVSCFFVSHLSLKFVWPFKIIRFLLISSFH